MERQDRFRTVYEAYYHRVLGYALRRTETPHDAADIVAETFLTAWRRFDELPDGDDARLWLYAVGRRVLANHRRAERRRERLRTAIELNRASADESSRAEHGLEPVGEAFRHLGSEDRELLRLIAWEGLTYEELAKVLDCSANAARIRAHRARRRLRFHLLEMGFDAKPTGAPGETEKNGQRSVPALEERA